MVYGVLVAQSEVPSLSTALNNALGRLRERQLRKSLHWMEGFLYGQPFGMQQRTSPGARDMQLPSGPSKLMREASARPPGNAHSGYVSGWFGAGWAGVTAVLLVFWSMWSRRRRLPLELQPVVTALLVLLAINNLTIPGVGGRSNPVFIFMMVLACLPPALRRRSSNPTPG